MNKYILKALLCLISLTACNRPRIVVENDDTEGFDIVKVYVGDTICNVNYDGEIFEVDSLGEPREGRLFHYHKNDTVINRFICCNKTYYGTVIEGHIFDYSKDSIFLLVDQKPVDSIFGRYISIYDDNGNFMYSRREYDTIQNWYDKQRILNLSNAHQYWIVHKQTLDVYGPFSYDDYLDTKKQISVPPSLMLKMEKYLGGDND